VVLWHCAEDFANQLLARAAEIVDPHARIGHTVEATRKFLRDIHSRGREKFGERTVRADETDDEGAAQGVADPVVCQKTANIEEVARMLAIGGSDYLAGIEVRTLDRTYWAWRRPNLHAAFASRFHSYFARIRGSHRNLRARDLASRDFLAISGTSRRRATRTPGRAVA
jgi:hypothetical protein